MSQRDPRLIGGIYQVGQVFIAGEILTAYTAYNRNTNDVVGLLVITLPPAADLQIVHRYFQPLERRRLIQSPHVIRVYDWGIDGSRAYIATDPPRGITLRHVLDNENIDLLRALDLSRQMTQGLKVLHEQGIVGVDLRPQLITVDAVAVTDRVQLDDVGLRSLLNMLGYVNSQRADDIGYLDPRYAPPEYIRGGPIGPWSDVYQLGLLLFELVTGRLPFVGRNHAETGVLQSTHPVPRMAQYKHDTPAALQDLVDRALAKNPAERFANAEMFLAALEALQLPPPPPRRSSSDEWPIIGATTAPPDTKPSSVGLTAEMRPVDKDATLVERTERRVQPPSSSTTLPQDVPTEAGVYAHLCFEKDGVETQRFAIKEKNVVVGRTDPKRGLTPDIDLSALDPGMTVSRQHARIRYEETFFYIEDLKSRNKTRLGELSLTPLKPELLQHGDTLHFGAVRLTFKVPGMPDLPVFKDRKQ